MRPSQILVLFALLLALATANSFLGFRYLSLTSEYRDHNLTHMSATGEANARLWEAAIPNAQVLGTTRNLIVTAKDQAVWCIDNLNAFETMVFRAIGAGPALQICENDIANANRALTLIDEMLVQVADPTIAGMIRSDQLLSLDYAIQRMLQDSYQFGPELTKLEVTVKRAVWTGMILAIGLLCVGFALLSRELIRMFQIKERQSKALFDAIDEIERQSLTDPLTGLANRRAFDRHFAAVRDTRRLTLIRIDLDRFKKVNDILGHEAGDFVLCEVAKLLKSVVEPGDFPARVGGDEFVLLCAPGKTLQDGRAVAEHLLDRVQEPVFFDNKLCLFGASFGVAEALDADMSSNELLSAADAALYKAKSAGRGTVELFTPEMRSHTNRERVLAERFRAALRDGEIIPFFQTQHDPKDWSLAGVEVLARWDHPDHGILAPFHFLGIAHQLGLEAEMDEVIFERAVDAMDALEREGYRVPRVAFNVSAARIMDPSFLPSACLRIPDRANRYAFEILETISYEDAGPHFDYAIDALKEHGFQIDVDDFGSGHASINSVLRIAPDALKIDRSIIEPLGRKAQAERMVAAVLDLAGSLNVQVIAEGVDTKQKALILRRMGCDMLQGYFFSKPMSFHDLKAALDAEQLRPPSQLTG